MTTLDQSQFLSRVGVLSGISDLAQVRRLSSFVLEAIAAQLATHDRSWLSGMLPWPLTPTEPRAAVTSLEQFAAQIAEREAVSTGFGLEHVESVGRALAEVLAHDERVRLRSRLPECLAPLFEFSQQRDEPRRLHGALGVGHTLAGGRPGSQHPLSQAEPHSAQADSVARAQNPHADTKLSSSRGTTQEREHEDLAEGGPGSSRPLGSAKR
jgi:uncharacterized protein (DUF2267 family)